MSTHVFYPYHSHQKYIGNSHSRLFFNYYPYGSNYVIGHPRYNTQFTLSNPGVNHVIFCPYGTTFDTELSVCKYKQSLLSQIDNKPIESVNSAPEDQGCI